MKIIFLTIILVLFLGCVNDDNNHATHKLMIWEFAASLEQNYHQMGKNSKFILDKKINKIDQNQSANQYSRKHLKGIGKSKYYSPETH